MCKSREDQTLFSSKLYQELVIILEDSAINDNVIPGI